MYKLGEPTWLTRTRAPALYARSDCVVKDMSALELNDAAVDELA